jgi:hypothetical protein
MFARKEGLIGGLTTEAAYDKKLKDYSSFAGLNTGDGAFDSTITFKHVANQMSGYALAGEGPTKWAYNDLGINLFWKALHRHVFTTEFNNGSGLAGATDTRLANPLQFQNSGTNTGKLFTSLKKAYGDQKNNTESNDAFCTGTGWQNDGVDDTATADNPNPPACRGLYGFASYEDLARVLYFWLRKGKWKSSQLLPSSYFPTQGGTITGALPASTKGLRTDLCSGVPCDTFDYLNIQSFGTANANIDRCAEFRYFWQYGLLFNKTAKTGSPCQTGQKKYNWPNAAPDAFCANGAGGRNLHCAIPSLGLVFTSTSHPDGNIVDGHIVGSATSNFSKLVEKLTKTVRTSNAGSCF